MNEQGNWVVLRSFTGKFRPAEKSKRTLVEVRCGCGAVEVRRADHVASGRTLCCKRCASKRTTEKMKDQGRFFIPKNQFVGRLSKTFYSRMRLGAKRRGLVFEVTQEYLWDLFLLQEEKCALTGWEITLIPQTKNSSPIYSQFTASLDRIDNTKGYIEGNVHWVHKEINRFKNNYSMEDLLRMCSAITAHAAESN